MVLVKEEITNSVNDNTIVDWYVAKDEADAAEWEGEQREDIRKWNHATPGIVSVRWGNFTYYRPEDFQNMSVSDLNGMPLHMLVRVLDVVRATV